MKLSSIAYEDIFDGYRRYLHKIVCPYFQKSCELFGRLQINPYLCHVKIIPHALAGGHEDDRHINKGVFRALVLTCRNPRKISTILSL